MTSLEQLVPSLEVCRQLQAAGFPQDTAMVWAGEHEFDFEAGQFDGCRLALIARVAVAVEHEVICAAPTAEEILKELPRTILKGQIYVLEVHRRGDILDVWEVDWYFNGLQLAASTTMTICQKESEAAVGAYLWWKKEVAG